MKTLEKIFNAFQWFCLIAFALGTSFVALSYVIRAEIKENHRDYDYGEYCDSVWNNDPEYYNDVLIETDEYQQYIAENGEWWR